MEEAGARVEVMDLHTMFNLPHVNQVYVMFRAKLLDLNFGPGPESLEVALYEEQDIPWGDIAFPVIEQTMRLFFEDRRRGAFGIHTGDIIRHILSNNERRYETRMLKRR